MALGWGIRLFEIRGVRNERFPRHSDDVLDELAGLREEYDIDYTAVSPGFFKCRMDDEEQVDYALGEGLDRTMDFMEGCDVPLMVCFGFEMETGTDEQAVELLQRLADRMAERDLGAAVENETHCRFNTPARIDQLLRMVDRPNLGANWDLGNLKEFATDGFPTGYELVKPHIVNVHAKDVGLLDDGETEWRPIGQGVCDWKGQMEALARERLVEHVTIENHCGPPEDVTPHNLRMLRQYVGE
jgi:sugar phosphate isomerase/epimerase